MCFKSARWSQHILLHGCRDGCMDKCRASLKLSSDSPLKVSWHAAEGAGLHFNFETAKTRLNIKMAKWLWRIKFTMRQSSAQRILSSHLQGCVATRSCAGGADGVAQNMQRADFTLTQSSNKKQRVKCQSCMSDKHCQHLAPNHSDAVVCNNFS